jgi:hypothetical protein
MAFWYTAQPQGNIFITGMTTQGNTGGHTTAPQEEDVRLSHDKEHKHGGVLISSVK